MKKSSVKKKKSSSKSKPVVMDIVPPQKPRRFWPYGVTLFAVLLFIDQYTKHIIRTEFPLYYNVKVLPGLWHTYVQNTGATWGMMQDSNVFFIWISVIAFGLLLYFYDQFSTTFEKIAYTLLLVGLWGNLIDRVSFGFVIDFIDFGWFPVFNIADSCITVGIILFLLEQIRKSRSVKN